MKITDIRTGQTYEGRHRGRRWRRGRPFPLRGAGRRPQDAEPRTVTGFFADPGGPREPWQVTGDDVLSAWRAPGVELLVEFEAEGERRRVPVDVFARWAQREVPA